MIDYLLFGIIVVVAVVFALISLGILRKNKEGRNEKEILLEGVIEANKPKISREEKVHIFEETKKELERINSKYTNSLPKDKFEDLFSSGFATDHSIRLRDAYKKSDADTALKLYLGNFVPEKAKKYSKKFKKEIKFYKRNQWF